ncbi:phosphoglycerate mutase family protein [Rhodococcus sp. NPDC059234]|uniref:phosphoglycerate mutase family protein n=1 Tax=Rhodococcus sp. NPDC059234 TaxID=3346781 RepID=UPI00366A97D8
MHAPERIVLLRHGESEANVDPAIYERLPDYRIPLTARGVEQARAAGERLRAEFDGRKVCAYVSPYLRAYQTLDALGIDDLVERRIEEPRLREQDWANSRSRSRGSVNCETATVTSSIGSPKASRVRTSSTG